MHGATHTDAAIHRPGPLSRAADVLGRDKLLIGTCVALALAVLFVDWLTPSAVAEGMLYSFIVLLSIRARAGRLTVAFAALSSVFIGIGFVVSPPGADLGISVTNRCLAIALAWMTAGVLLRRLHVEQERDLALRRGEEARAHIQFLHGLLPICAWCKKIRAADGSWVKLESYISQHSDASFTHSICPECRSTVVHENHDAPPGGSAPQP